MSCMPDFVSLPQLLTTLVDSPLCSIRFNLMPQSTSAAHWLIVFNCNYITNIVVDIKVIEVIVEMS